MDPLLQVRSGFTVVCCQKWENCVSLFLCVCQIWWNLAIPESDKTWKVLISFSIGRCVRQWFFCSSAYEKIKSFFQLTVFSRCISKLIYFWGSLVVLLLDCCSPPPNWEKNGEKIIFMVSDHRLRPSAPPIDYPFSCVYKCGIYNFSKEYSEKILVLSKNDHR